MRLRTGTVSDDDQVQITIYATRAFKRRVRIAADEAGMTVTAYITAVLTGARPPELSP